MKRKRLYKPRTPRETAPVHVIGARTSVTATFRSARVTHTGLLGVGVLIVAVLLHLGPSPHLPGAAVTTVATRVTAAGTVVLQAVPERNVLGEHDEFTLVVSIRNDRGQPLVYRGSACAPVRVVVTPPGPPFEGGRSQVGLGAQFKAFALDNGLAPGGVPARSPQGSLAEARDCPPSFDDSLIAPGKSVEAVFHWKPELVTGLAAPSGGGNYEVTFDFDPVDDGPSPDLAKTEFGRPGS